MDSSRNRKLGVAAVLVVALAAGGAALAAGKLHGSSNSSSGFRGGPPGFSGGPGTFNGPRSFGYGSGGFGFRDRDHDGGGLGFGAGPFGELGAAAGYLGLSTGRLMQQVFSGKTLAQIANGTSGKSASGLIDAMVAAERKQLDQAVASGRLSKSTAQQLESNLKTRVTSMVNGSFGPGGGGFGRRPYGQGGFGFGGPPGGNGRQQAPTTTTPATHI